MRNVFIMKGDFPFSVKQLRFNQETEAAILEARDIASGKKDTRRYSSVKELFEELDAEAE